MLPDTATTVVHASHVPGSEQGHWTYEAYAQLPEAEGFRYEIIEGVLYIAPAPGPYHERGVISLGARLVTAIEDTGLGQVFASPDVDGKRGAYARMGIPEYWIVDPVERNVELLTLEGDAYRSVGIFSGTTPLTSPLLPGLNLLAHQLSPRPE